MLGVAEGEVTRRARAAAREQWGRNPAGTMHADAEEGTAEFFAQMTASRYRLQPWHPALLHRFAPDGRLLEIGSGAGTDHAELAKMAVTTVALDLAHRGAALTQRRLRLEERRGSAVVADGERMPLASSAFDAVYSFGVIHHTDHPEAVAAEMHRVLKPGGRFLVALYHRASVFALYKAVRYIGSGAFLRERWSEHLALVEAGADQVDERPLVRLYSRRQARALFSSFDEVSTEVLHGGVRWRFLQRPLFARRWGWYVVVTGRKPRRNHPSRMAVPGRAPEETVNAAASGDAGRRPRTGSARRGWPPGGMTRRNGRRPAGGARRRWPRGDRRSG